MILTAFGGLFLLSLVGWRPLQLQIYRIAGLLSAFLGIFLWLRGDKMGLDAFSGFGQGLEILPQMGVWLKMNGDSLSWSFGLLILAIATCVFFYAHGYTLGQSPQRRFHSSLILFTLAMLGLVFSDNIFCFFVFWELTTLSSYLLISLKDKDAEVRESSRIVFFTTLSGGFFLLAALIWAQQVALASGYNLYEASHFSSLMKIDWLGNSQTPFIFILILIAAASKSAQFPFHFWLPQAMSAPTPVSSFLHSATMVKAGIFLLARFYPGFGMLDLWSATLIPLGISTGLISALLAASEKDLKKILAWTTVSVLGTLTFLLGLGTPLALKAFIILLFAHALYKASLFQIAGNIEKSCGTRDLDQLGGLYSSLKWTGLAASLAALSAAGAPPFFGFIGKELVLKSVIERGNAELILLLILTMMNCLLFAMTILVGFRAFWGRSMGIKGKKSLAFSMSFAPLVLAVAGLAIGLAPAFFELVIGRPTHSEFFGIIIPLKLSLWHGVESTALIALGLSFFAFIVGGLLVFNFDRWKKSYRRFFQRIPDSRAVLSSFLNTLHSIFWRLSQIQLQRSLSSYMLYMASFLLIIFGSVAIKIYADKTFDFALFQLSGNLETDTFLSILLIATCLAATSIIFIYRFIVAAIILGLVGASLAVLFAWFGAADLAFTQILAELLIAVFVATFGFKLKDLPTFFKDGIWFPRMLLAICFGICLFFLTLIGPPLETEFIARDFYLLNALDSAFGRNVVNVILVDFRALDTLNEVIVVLIAAIGVTALRRSKSKSLRLKRGAEQ